MNLKYIMRKQQLGICHPDDIFQWASTLIFEREKNGLSISQSLGELGIIDCALWEKFDDRLMRSTVQLFNAAVEELGIDYQFNGIEDTPYVRAVQSIYNSARKSELFFRIVDLRPISELGEDLGDIELRDKMVVECGCIPIGDHWLEYSPKHGREELQTILEYEILPLRPTNLQLSENNVLANQFLDWFDDSVCFYGNNGVQSKSLQSRYDFDFGLVVRDSKHIGFLLLAEDIP